MSHLSKKSVLKLDLFRVLADQSPLGVFVWRVVDKKDVKACVTVFVNQRALGVLGFEKKDILNRCVGEVFSGLEKSKLPLVFKALLKTKKAQQIASFLYGDERVRSRYFRVDLVLLSGDCVGVFFDDISPQMEAQGELKEKVRELERLNDFMVGREMKMMELKKEIERFGGGSGGRQPSKG